MLKTFSGSWFEFQHHNPPEGKYWNPVCRAFSEEQWREKVREMKSLDMKYISRKGTRDEIARYEIYRAPLHQSRL